jgi:hypothetical protein
MPKPARRRKACPLSMLAISLAFQLLVGSRKHRTCNRRSRPVKAQKLWPQPFNPKSAMAKLCRIWENIEHPTPNIEQQMI